MQRNKAAPKRTKRYLSAKYSVIFKDIDDNKQFFSNKNNP